MCQIVLKAIFVILLTGIFVILLRQAGFESDGTKTKFQTITS